MQPDINTANTQYQLLDQRSAGQNFGDSGQQIPSEHNDKSGQQSKLQASLKQYERRNKKKRPPNYYQQDDSQEQAGLGQEVAPEILMHKNFTVPPPGHPAHYVANPANRDTAGINAGYPGYPAGAYSVKNPQAFVNNEYVNPNIVNQEQHLSGIIKNDSANGLPRANPGLPPQCGIPPPHVGEELVEVVVDKVPDNTFHIPPRIETSQNQDHERTSTLTKVGQYANDKRDTNAISAQATVHEMQTQNTVFPTDVNSNRGAKSNRVDVSVKDTQSEESSSHITVADNKSNNLITQSSDTEPTVQDKNLNAGLSAENISKTDTPVTNTGESNVPVDVKVYTSSQVTENVQTPKQEPQKPKPTTWAGLFKSSNSPVVMPQQNSESPVIVANPSKPEETVENDKPELPPLPVPAAEDSVAKELGGKEFNET